MKYIILILALSASYSYSQQSETKTLDSLKIELSTTQKKIKKLTWVVGDTETTLESRFNELATDLATQSATLNTLVNEKDKALRTQVTAIYDSLEQNTARVKANDDIIKSEQAKSEKNFLYSIIGILVLLLLLVVIYFLIQKRSKSIEQKAGDLDASTQELKAQLTQLSTSTSEDLASALEKFASVSSTQPIGDAEPDHSMVIAFAKQIVSMENNLSRMDPESRGLSKIKKAIEKMHITLGTMDYELPLMLGKDLVVGDIIDIDIQKADETIGEGKRIVYNVQKAEILYKGKQIQKAKVDVKYNPND